MDGNSFITPEHDRAPIICLSHLRWNSVFQRPQQLMSRFAADRAVYFFEEPIEHATPELRLETCCRTGVVVVTPMLPLPHDAAAIRGMLDRLMMRIGPGVGWYYTPMALDFSDHIVWAATVFDVMDELSAFRFAPATLRANEKRLMERADVVFTGGASLFAAKAGQHSNIHCMPSGVDLGHFMTARGPLLEPDDQMSLRRPLLGYFGVIDERMDMDLLAGMAALRPKWDFVMLGPVAKLGPEELPDASNIHWLGAKDYTDLPSYLSHWDVALMPFAINEATRFISPTKAPEYLAGGKRVVSTPIHDVVQRFAGLEAVSIAADAAGFVKAAGDAIERSDVSDFVAVDDLLATISWEGIHGHMDALLAASERKPRLPSPALHIASAAISDYLVVGAGFAGAVVAEQLATSGSRVLVVDRRPHVGGNAYDEVDDAGLLIHRYGPHIFHTNSDEVLAYLSRFTAWRSYEHRVLARVPAGLVPMPINRVTVNQVFGMNLSTDEETAAFFASLAAPMSVVSSARDFVVAAVGTKLYEMFFHGYTLKQWGVPPEALDRSVTARVPTRTSDDDRYFLDKHQCMPASGYTAMFDSMLDHPNITVLLGTSHDDIPRRRYRHTVFTGPIDAYYGHRYGALPYRSLIFEHETLDAAQVQPVGTINYPTLDTPYTRCTEFKHLTGQIHAKTSICRERSSGTGDPYYPIPNAANQSLFKRYQALADTETEVTFLGRLGTYRYMNMDQVVAQALATARRLQSGRLQQPALLSSSAAS